MRLIADRWINLADGFATAAAESHRLAEKWGDPLQQIQQSLPPLRTRLLERRSHYLTVAIFAGLGSILLIGIPFLIWALIQYSRCKKRLDFIDHPPSLQIESEWWKRLGDGITLIEKPGDVGEVELLRALAFSLPDTYTATRSLLVRKNLDADVFILGPAGIFAIESKFLKGVVSYREGKWGHEKTYYGEGGVLVTEAKTIDWGFDSQWLKETEAIRQTLEMRLPVHGNALGKLLGGGLAFTHPEVTLKIASDCPVEYGDVNYWRQKILTSPVRSGPDIPLQLQALDVLFAFASKLDLRPEKSAVDLSKEIAQQSSRRMQDYLAQCDRWIAEQNASASSKPAPSVRTAASPAPAQSITQNPVPPPPAANAKKSSRRWSRVVPALGCLLVAMVVCGAAIPLSGAFAPQACARTKTKLYERPVSSAHVTTTIDRKACVQLDARTSGGWGRVTGISLYRGSWVLLTSFTYDKEQVNSLSIVKP